MVLLLKNSDIFAHVFAIIFESRPVVTTKRYFRKFNWKNESIENQFGNTPQGLINILLDDLLSREIYLYFPGNIQ